LYDLKTTTPLNSDVPNKEFVIKAGTHIILKFSEEKKCAYQQYAIFYGSMKIEKQAMSYTLSYQPPS
jgi:hypothetical protein